MTNNEAKIVFWGTPNFAAKILEGLISAQFCPILVVTAPDKVKGRGLKKTPSEVKKIAKKWGLEVAEPAKLRQNEAFATTPTIRPRSFYCSGLRQNYSG